MCMPCLSRRRFLATAAALPAGLAACDDAPDLVTDEQAANMGQAAWEQILADSRLSQNRDYQQALSGVSRRLLDTAGINPAGWQIAVFADPTANAFALPGGRIGVFEGMFEVIANEDQLAAIVGHEIGHLEAEHAKARIGAQIAKDASLRAIVFALNLGDVQFAEEIAAALGLGVEVGLLLPFSRDQELEADAFGLRLMDRAAYDAREAVDLWRRMAAASDRRAPAFLATHPTPRARIREIEEILTAL